MKYLLAKGYGVIPVNPGLAGQELLGQKVYARLEEVPGPSMSSTSSAMRRPPSASSATPSP